MHPRIKKPVGEHLARVALHGEDFYKYASQKELLRLQRVFSRIPRHLARKTKFSHYDPSARANEVSNIIDLLTKARVCHPVVRSHCNGIPLDAEADEKSFKLIFLDVGLAGHVLGLKWNTVQELAETALVNEGGLAEQLIGQHLLNIGEGRQTPGLHYWLREGRANNAEVDYVIAQGQKIYPVEVKAGKSGSLKSLHQCLAEKKTGLAFRFDLTPPRPPGTDACAAGQGHARPNGRNHLQPDFPAALCGRRTQTPLQTTG